MIKKNSKPKLIAYKCFPSPSPADDGCILVYAPNRSKARHLAAEAGAWGAAYIDMRARREPTFDRYASGNTGNSSGYAVESDAGLPAGVSFYDEEYQG